MIDVKFCDNQIRSTFNLLENIKGTSKEDINLPTLQKIG